jgi:hypothetical protein
MPIPSLSPPPPPVLALEDLEAGAGEQAQRFL